MITLEDAWARLFALARPPGPETIAVDEAAGRYLAADLIARRTRPAADLSAMDGFAVAGAGPWRVIGESRAGVPFAGSLAGGEATRISTGAACPEGTEGIVLIEDGALAGEELRAPPPEPGRWIRRAGFDFAAGDVLIEKGTRIGPAQLGLARAAGHGSVVVARRPRLAVLECGDELAADPEAIPPDGLPASNGAMLAAMAAGFAEVRRIGPLPDDRDGLARAFAQTGDADVLVTIGGASVGEHDHIRGALEDCGATLAFWRVAIRPGKPLLVAGRGEQIVLGLPGNPNSSFVTAWLFVLPLLRAVQGAASPLPAALPLALAAPVPAGGQRREFLRARLAGGRAEPLPERDSSALRTLAAADLLIDRPIGAPPHGAGEVVDCYWLGNGGIA